MLHIDVPGFGPLALAHLVTDFNGTLAVDGQPLSGVRERIEALSQFLAVHVLTADTFGTVRTALEGWPCRVEVLAGPSEDDAKLAYIQSLGEHACAFIGQGRNDRLALLHSALGVAVIQAEGAASAALAAADMVAPDILCALDLLLHPQRIKASLRV